MAQLAEVHFETPAQKRLRRIAPWFMSLALHAALVILGFLVTWTVVLLKDDPDPPVIVADFDSLAFDPLTPLGEDELEPLEMSEEDLLDLAPVESTADMASEMELDPIAMLSDAASSAPAADFAPQTSQGSVSFVGLSSSNARSIVYVIDASGSMIASLQIVVEELARSLDELTSQQRYGIIFFQQNDAVVVPPENRLTVATSEAKLDSLRWINDNIVPAGRSNPLPAIEEALRLEPDVIFMLSENITGSGQYEIDQSELLSLLDDMNPVVRSTGRRRTVINCIQFLDPDPLDTLRRIADAHGSGGASYKFLDRRELGIVSP